MKIKKMLLKILLLLILCVAYGVKSETCPTLLHSLAEKQMELLFCVTTNSVPVTMCAGCINHYQNVLKAYDILVANCTSTYFNKDRINLISSTESVLTGLWSKAYCDDCSYNNNSFIFHDKNITFYNCLHKNKGNPCEGCKNEYLNLNNFYINLDQHNNGEVCYDLQDSINRTRSKWSKELKCCRREYNMMLFICVLGVTLCLPLMFYGGSYLVTKRMDQRHEALNDEDPIFNSTLPSISNITNMDVSNNPIQTHSPVNNSTTNGASGIKHYPTSGSGSKNDLMILNEDLSSSDDEILVNPATVSKEKLN